MAGLAHIGLGFALKWAGPKAPVIALAAAAEAVDLLCLPASLLGGDAFVMASTHSLVAGLAWAALAMGIAALCKADRRSTLVIGLAVISHWFLDVLTHPMGAIYPSMKLPDMPIGLSAGSPRLGLGLYNHSFALAMAFDLGITVLGVGAYVLFKLRERKSRAAKAA
jgi:membrane-bound metal-dependent hydrolase YbcI (DUF457 family)